MPSNDFFNRQPLKSAKFRIANHKTINTSIPSIMHPQDKPLFSRRPVHCSVDKIKKEIKLSRAKQ